MTSHLHLGKRVTEGPALVMWSLDVLDRSSADSPAWAAISATPAPGESRRNFERVALCALDGWCAGSGSLDVFVGSPGLSDGVGRVLVSLPSASDVRALGRSWMMWGVPHSSNGWIHFPEGGSMPSTLSASLTSPPLRK